MEAPPVILSRRKIPLWPVAGLLAAALAWFILYRFDPEQNSFYPRCSLYTTTGLFCPGCGSQRALHHLAHGEILLAMRYNMMMVAAIPVGLFYLMRMSSAWVKGASLTRFLPSSRVLLWMGAALALFGILRNIPLSPFTYLAPP